MIDAEKLLDRLLGELPKPDGSPESLNAYLDAVERIVKIVRECSTDVTPLYPPTPIPPKPQRPRHPFDEILPPDWREALRPLRGPGTSPIPKMTWERPVHNEDDGA